MCNLAACVNYGTSREAMEASVWGGRDFFHCDQNFYLYKEREKEGGGAGGAKAASIRILMSGFDNYVHFLRFIFT